MKNKKLTIIIIFLIIAGVGGYYLGVSDKSGQCASELSRYQEAVDSFFPPTPEQVFSIDGIIKEIGKDYLIIETPSLSKRILPGEEPVMEERKITVSENTEIIKRNPMVFEFSEEEGTEIPVFKEEKYSFSELKSGDSVIIEAEENIKNESEFPAAKIIMRELETFPVSGE